MMSRRLPLFLCLCCLLAGFALADILWQTSHETGDFYDWTRHTGWMFWDSDIRTVVDTPTDSPRIFGTSIYNSRTPPGDCQTSISSDVARTGQYSMLLRMTGAQEERSQGCRTFRTYLEIDGADGIALPDGYYSAWYYLPQEVQTKVWWNIFQFKSKSDSSGDSEPMLSFNIDSSGQGERTLYVYHKKVGDNGVCDCLGSCDSLSYDPSVDVNIPIQEWFHVEAYIRQSTTTGTKVQADGILRVYINGVESIDATGICTSIRADGRLQWSVNNYANDIIPPDVDLYIDDAMIRTERSSEPTIAPQPVSGCSNEDLVCRVWAIIRFFLCILSIQCE